MKSSGDGSIVDTCHDHIPPANVRHPHLNGVIIVHLTSMLLFCNDQTRNSSAATTGWTGVGAGGRIAWMAISGSGMMVVRNRARTGPTTNAPAVESDNAAASDGNHRQRTVRASITSGIAGITWRGGYFARCAARCPCACLYSDRLTGSDHHDQNSRGTAQSESRLASAHHDSHCSFST